MGMKDDGYEVLSRTPLEAQDRRIARMRERRCASDALEQERYEYAPNEARQNKRPGYPDPEYGDT